MMILKIKKNRVLIYVILGYFFVTWGVNRLINPLVYFQNIVENREVELSVVESSEGMEIQLSENAEQFPYLSLDILVANEFSIDAYVDGVSETAELHRVDKGINNIKLECVGKEIITIDNAIEDSGVLIQTAYQSAYPRVDLMKSLEVAIAYILFVLVWESAQYIKKRYTQQ